MNCIKCGQPLDAGVAFCGNCGTPIAQASVPVQGVTQANPAIVAPVAPQVNQVPQPPTPPQPIAQTDANTMTQVLNNQPAQQNSNINFGNPVVGAVGGNNLTPAYATATPGAQKGEKRAIIALIFGILGIPASLIPILGLAFGITGLVLSTTVISKYKHTVTILAIIFSSLSILTAIGLWVYAIQHDPALHKTTTSSTISSPSSNPSSYSSASLTPIDTPCYSVKIDSGLSNSTPTGCNFDAASPSQEYTVDSQNIAGMTDASISANGPSALQAAANAIGAKITSEGNGKFSGSTAYIGYMQKTNSNVNGEIAAVYHPTANGDNLFIVAHFMDSTQKADFGPLEATWVWK